jgi:DNA-binding transcriptional LysR family regulator
MSPKDLVDDGHECIQAIDPATGKPFGWEFWRGNEKIAVTVSGNLTVTDAGTKIGACLAGYGIAQVIDLGIETHLRAGTLVPVLTDWPDETFPLYVYYPSRNHVPAKVRAFIDFVAGMMPGLRPGSRFSISDDSPGLARSHSHSIVAGGLELTS